MSCKDEKHEIIGHHRSGGEIGYVELCWCEIDEPFRSERDQLRAEVERSHKAILALTAEVEELAILQVEGWNQAKYAKELLDVANLQVRTMREAIERAIKDSESGIGWGPDVTVVEYLRKALKGVTE